MGVDERLRLLAIEERIDGRRSRERVERDSQETREKA
jgi:hypothetical protein